jgi:hypothetical protein
VVVRERSRFLALLGMTERKAKAKGEGKVLARLNARYHHPVFVRKPRVGHPGRGGPGKKQVPRFARNDRKKGNRKGKGKGKGQRQGAKAKALARLNARYPTLHPSEQARLGPRPATPSRGWGTRFVRYPPRERGFSVSELRLSRRCRHRGDRCRGRWRDR